MTVSNATIAVTGLNASESPGPGVAVIRAIRKADEFDGKIVGLSYDPLDTGIYIKGICDSAYLIPYPSQGAKVLLRRVVEIHEQTPLDAIIPTLDAELPAFLAIEAELQALGIGLFLPTSECLKMCSKPMLTQLKEQGVAVPRGKCVTDVPSLYRLAKEFTYPLVIKGRFYEADVVYSVVEAERSFRRLAAKWGLPVIVQEFLPGEEYDVVAVGDGKGGLIGAVPMRKMQLTDKGKAWGGVTISDPKLTAFVKETMARLKWRGPCELETIKSNSDGSYYLIELNPRFPAWCFLSVAAGQNLPWYVAQLALGKTVEKAPPYDIGVMFLRHSIDMVYPLEMFEAMTTLGEVHK